jgi:FixJ family two-component response regulator
MTNTGVTVYVVDDDASVCRSVSRLLRSSGFASKIYSTAESFLADKQTLTPGCLILDLQMPGLNGLELQRALVSANRKIPIIFVSGHALIPDSVQAMKDGAVDFLTKPYDHSALMTAIQRALEKDEINRKAQGELRTVEFRFKRLTPRERQVLFQVVKGKLNKQIAYKLKISEKTVKVHRARVMEKMRASSIAELVRLTEKISSPDSSASR